ncbi:hypothetical protein FRAHR75_1280008 [Frankia sp. Hr75.2]|nr:hypothetical protein FRAHR75_1280008 [Frankia sp. Hr75.2]SQD99872.1 hypothetical protein FMEAI12_5770008 [Parafrankia sp. Ea1.12]
MHIARAPSHLSLRTQTTPARLSLSELPTRSSMPPPALDSGMAPSIVSDHFSVNWSTYEHAFPQLVGRFRTA